MVSELSSTRIRQQFLMSIPTLGRDLQPLWPSQRKTKLSSNMEVHIASTKEYHLKIRGSQQGPKLRVCYQLTSNAPVDTETWSKLTDSKWTSLRSDPHSSSIVQWLASHQINMQVWTKLSRTTPPSGKRPLRSWKWMMVHILRLLDS